MLNLFLTAFVTAFLGAGVRRPFVFVLAYAYIDIVAPQKVTWGFLAHIPVSLIAFICAVTAWLVAENKDGIRVSPRQFVLLLLLVYCGLTTRSADFPEEAFEKWGWVWKALVFALFLPFTLRTRLRIEALVLIMVLSVGVIVIGGGIKTAAGGGGYGELKLLVNDNQGLYEGSIISTVAVCVIPLALWLAKYGTIFKPSWPVRLFALGICFACLLMPVGTQARTGLICIAVLGLLMLRTTKKRFTYIGVLAGLALVAMPLLPHSFTERMSTIGNHQSDQSASTRVAVWKWTIEFAKTHPFGGGFNAYLQNKVSYDKIQSQNAGDNNTAIETERIEEKGRAYHSSYFEMLGEQGYPGLGLWLLLHIMGVVHMEVIRRRYAKDPPAELAWVTPLADALQQAQIVYLFGGAFVGIAFQPFCYMLVGLQCGLSAYIGRVKRSTPAPFRAPRPQAAAKAEVAA
ncbi:MAG: putative O-glycosylation ligase, exosortase A system-associated [Novosphingobium sp.]